MLTPDGDPTGRDPEAGPGRDHLGEVLAGFAERSPDVAVSVEVDRGRAEEAIVRATGGHDLVVLGSRSHSRLSRLVTGDVDRWVVAHASCPVAIVPEPDPDPAAAPA